MRARLKLSLLGFGKILFLIFLLYTSWFRERYGVHQIFLYGPVILLSLIVLLDMYLKKRIVFKNFPENLKMYFILAAYSIIAGVITAPNKVACISSIITFFAYSVVCFDVYYISMINGSIQWILNMLVFCGMVCSYFVLFHGVIYRTSGVNAITLGKDNNPNYLGMVILVSLFSLICNYGYISKHIGAALVLVAVFSLTIALTASRKNFLCLSVLLIGWILLYINTLREGSDKSAMHQIKLKNFIYIIVLIVATIIGSVLAIEHFSGSSIYLKFLKSITNGEGVGSRILLYKEAWQMFLQHPILGVGFDQYRVYSSIGKYSHSTYAEILSCLGIVGFAIFFVPIFRMYISMILRLIKHRKNNYTLAIAIIMFTVELIIAFGQIFIYEFYHMLILTILFWILQKCKRENSIILNY